MLSSRSLLLVLPKTHGLFKALLFYLYTEALLSQKRKALTACRGLRNIIRNLLRLLDNSTIPIRGLSGHVRKIKGIHLHRETIPRNRLWTATIPVASNTGWTARASWAR